MKGVRFGLARRELAMSGPFFETLLWRRASAGALKLWVWLAFKAMHPAQDIDGEIVRPGQYRRSLARLASDVGLKDWRTARRALLELEAIGAVGVLQKMQEAPTNNAGASDILCPAKNVGLFRKPQLVNVCSVNELEDRPAKNVGEKDLYRSKSVGRRRPADAGPSPSEIAEAKRERHIFDLARALSERTGLSHEAADAEIRSGRFRSAPVSAPPLSLRPLSADRIAPGSPSADSLTGGQGTPPPTRLARTPERRDKGL
jgi:hypothetical protein